MSLHLLDLVSFNGCPRGAGGPGGLPGLVLGGALGSPAGLRDIWEVFVWTRCFQKSGKSSASPEGSPFASVSLSFHISKVGITQPPAQIVYDSFLSIFTATAANATLHFTSLPSVYVHNYNRYKGFTEHLVLLFMVHTDVF